MPNVKSSTEELRLGVLARDRRALAKSITLLESQHVDHQAQARALLDSLLPHTGRSTRIGITGNPGAGKSTLIEQLGLNLIERGHRVAVLAIDPSSSVNGGSILGDKTRMERLSVHPSGFIRPTPSGGSLGGVAARTREAMLLCEAAGFDVLIVETVGVGQSEGMVANLTDVFVLLHLPNTGDELQAMKKGVLELANFVVVNKADLDRTAAERAEQQISGILHLLQPAEQSWPTEVFTISALAGQGIDHLWSRILAYRDTLQSSGEWDHRRQRQALAWMWQIVEEKLRSSFRNHPAVQAQLAPISAQVSQGTLSANAAANRLLELFKSG